MSSPRANTSSSAASSSSAPSATSAENSPTLWPAASSVVAERARPRAARRAAPRAAPRAPAGRARCAPARRRDGAGRAPSASRSSVGLRSTTSSSEKPSRARVQASARSQTARAARERARPSAPEAAPLHALAAEGEHGRAAARRAPRRSRASSPSASTRHLDDLQAVLQRDAGRLQLERGAERDRRDEGDPPAAQRGRVARADVVDDERRGARRGPGAVHDRPRQAAQPRRQDAAMQRVVVAGDARERVHARRRAVVRLGERDARARVAAGRRPASARARRPGARARLRRGRARSVADDGAVAQQLAAALHAASPERGTSVVQRLDPAGRRPQALRRRARIRAASHSASAPSVRTSSPCERSCAASPSRSATGQRRTRPPRWRARRARSQPRGRSSASARRRGRRARPRAPAARARPAAAARRARRHGVARRARARRAAPRTARSTAAGERRPGERQREIEATPSCVAPVAARCAAASAGRAAPAALDRRQRVVGAAGRRAEHLPRERDRPRVAVDRRERGGAARRQRVTSAAGGPSSAGIWTRARRPRRPRAATCSRSPGPPAGSTSR